LKGMLKKHSVRVYNVSTQGPVTYTCENVDARGLLYFVDDVAQSGRNVPAYHQTRYRQIIIIYIGNKS